MSLYDRETLAYLAGCLDSDGFFTIRRDTRSMKAAGRTPTHVAMVGLRQVTPQVPHVVELERIIKRLRADIARAAGGDA